MVVVIVVVAAAAAAASCSKALSFIGIVFLGKEEEDDDRMRKRHFWSLRCVAQWAVAVGDVQAVRAPRWVTQQKRREEKKRKVDFFLSTQWESERMSSLTTSFCGMCVSFRPPARRLVSCHIVEWRAVLCRAGVVRPHPFPFVLDLYRPFHSC